MKKQQKDTAILYFTRTAGEEARKKSFIRGGSYTQNRAVAQELIKHTFKKIEASGFPFRVITSHVQQGQTFGEKFANAFQKLFEEGFEKVVAVGNDCIKLKQTDFCDAAALLREQPLVAGPTADGGTYLLGMHHSAFHKAAFRELSWETGQLMHDFEQYARGFHHSLACLNLSVDIDHEETLRQWLLQAASSVVYLRLVLFIQSIISSIYFSFRFSNISSTSRQFRTNLRHRGPPVS